MSRKTIVLSGINFSEGGPLTIYKECLRCVEEYLLKDYEIIALVHNKELFSEFSFKVNKKDKRNLKKELPHTPDREEKIEYEQYRKKQKEKSKSWHYGINVIKKREGA